MGKLFDIEMSVLGLGFGFVCFEKSVFTKLGSGLELAFCKCFSYRFLLRFSSCQA